MNISAIIAATILVAAVGLFIGVFLGAAGKKFAVEIDEKEVAIREALPGNNCGGACKPLPGRRRACWENNCRYYGTGGS